MDDESEHIEITNAIALAKRWWQWRWTFYYADTFNYMADNLLERRGVHVKFLEEYQHPDESYVIVCCKVPNIHLEGFLAAMHDLHNLMLIGGHLDYDKFCKKMAQMLEGDEDE